ncbi:MAG TPA: transglycosylase family protein [Acidimicrobiales bacterium]|nr:transglycosylase family protein [Acidimicrobiales bacterium]
MRKHRLYGFVLALTMAGLTIVQMVSGTTSVATAAISGQDVDHTSRSTHAVHRPKPSVIRADGRTVTERSGSAASGWRAVPPGAVSASSAAATAALSTAQKAEQLHRYLSTMVWKQFVQNIQTTQYLHALQLAQFAQALAASQAAPSAAPAGGVWAELRQCESGGNYADDTGNGYYGAYQFSAGTWASLGYGGLPSQAPPAVQDAAAQALEARSGWGQWPACSAALGL